MTISFFVIPGPFVAGLEFAADVTADVVGKPEASFFMSALDELGVSPDRAVMIGDVCAGRKVAFLTPEH